MKNLILITICTLTFCAVKAQTKTTVKDTLLTNDFSLKNNPPEYPGGIPSA